MESMDRDQAFAFLGLSEDATHDDIQSRVDARRRQLELRLRAAGTGVNGEVPFPVQMRAAPASASFGADAAGVHSERRRDLSAGRRHAAAAAAAGGHCVRTFSSPGKRIALAQANIFAYLSGDARSVRMTP